MDRVELYLHYAFLLLFYTIFCVKSEAWLNLFNAAELSPKKYWRGPKSQEVGEVGDYTYRYTVTIRMTSVLRWEAVKARF